MKLSDSEHDVTGAELAKIAGDYSPATISRLRRSGILKRTKGGKYNVRESLQAIIAHEQKRLHEGQHNDPVLTPLRAEHLETQIALLKHRLAVETGKVHDKVACCQSLLATHSAESRILWGMASRLIAAHPELTPLRVLIESEVDDVLAKLKSGSAYNVAFTCPHCKQIVKELVAVEPQEVAA